MNLSVVSAVNDEEVLRTCLLKSPDAASFDELILQRGYDRAGNAYNDAIERARHDLVVMLHQDLYLPAGWLDQLGASVEFLDRTAPDWGVLGVFGVSAQSACHGHLYCAGNGRVLGNPLGAPKEVVTLDEIALVIRRSSGLRLDRSLPGFHFYGTDLCLNARERNLKAFVVPAFCVHNSNEYAMFPKAFWDGYRHMRRKWKSMLPVRTPCVEIRRSWMHPYWYSLRRSLWLKRDARPMRRRVVDPAALYSQLEPELAGMNSTPALAAAATSCFS